MTGIPGLFWLNLVFIGDSAGEFMQLRPSVDKRLARGICFTPVREADLVASVVLPCSVDMLCGNAENSCIPDVTPLSAISVRLGLWVGCL